MKFDIGTFLLPCNLPVTAGGETGVDFMEVLGGDADTMMVIAMVTPDGLIRGVPLGKDRPVIPSFMPSWDASQLETEISMGVWTHIALDHPEHKNYDAEGRRRSEMLLDILDNA